MTDDSRPAALWTALARRMLTSRGARANAAQGLRDVRRQRADSVEATAATRTAGGRAAARTAAGAAR